MLLYFRYLIREKTGDNNWIIVNYKSLDKLEALIQHNESPLKTWSENEYELNRKYAFDTVAYSEWLTGLREEILKDTINKIETEK